jgi:hypothetical protein
MRIAHYVPVYGPETLFNYTGTNVDPFAHQTLYITIVSTRARVLKSGLFGCSPYVPLGIKYPLYQSSCRVVQGGGAPVLAATNLE